MTTTAATSPSRRGRPARRRTSVGSAIIGVIGELMITVGLLLALFVAWQLWYTDYEAGLEQRSLSAELDEAFIPSPEIVGEPITEPPPVAVEPPPLDATTFGRLWVPRWDNGDNRYNFTITQGVDRATVLDVLGIGHYEQTAMPGEIGNFAIAGHRQSHGKPFYNITTLENDDKLIVETADAWYVYTVVESEIVLPTQTDVIAANPFDPQAPPDVAAITLTTCHPLFSTKERFIVHGVLESWMPRESGRPAELGAAA